MSQILRRLVRTVRAGRVGRTARAATSPRTAGGTGDARSPRADAAPSPARASYPGDHTGPLRPVYRPDLDGEPDPGEIVWTWVPYEEDHTRGKDRPVLVVGHDGPWLLALMLSSRDHDARPDGRGGRWLDLGTGDWDPRRRPSEVRLDRVLRVAPQDVRREGAVLDRSRFDAVAAALEARDGRRRS